VLFLELRSTGTLKDDVCLRGGILTYSAALSKQNLFSECSYDHMLQRSSDVRSDILSFVRVNCIPDCFYWINFAAPANIDSLETILNLGFAAGAEHL
tara:strand:+ start:201 stop:491 length:291 start_codon:yes stop_codon:yes gene_type:complete